MGSPWTAPDVPARSGRSILHLPVLVVRGIQRSVRLLARATMQRSYMPCTNTTAFGPKWHLPSVTAWGVILWLLDSRRVGVLAWRWPSRVRIGSDPRTEAQSEGRERGTGVRLRGDDDPDTNASFILLPMKPLADRDNTGSHSASAPGAL